MADYYEILEIHESASSEVIKAAYRALCNKYHPDTNGTSAEGAAGRMAEINAAYETLKDPKKRKAYDATRQQKNGAAIIKDAESRVIAAEAKCRAAEKNEALLKEQVIFLQNKLLESETKVKKLDTRLQQETFKAAEAEKKLKAAETKVAEALEQAKEAEFAAQEAAADAREAEEKKRRALAQEKVARDEAAFYYNLSEDEKHRATAFEKQNALLLAEYASEDYTCECGQKFAARYKFCPYCGEKSHYNEVFESKTAEIRTMVLRRTRPDDEDYGISPENPICVKSQDEAKNYLNRLTPERCERVKWVYVGSSIMSVNGIDEVEVFEYQAVTPEKRCIYFAETNINFYRAPLGYCFSTKTEESEIAGYDIEDEQNCFMYYCPNCETVVKNTTGQMLGRFACPTCEIQLKPLKVSAYEWSNMRGVEQKKLIGELQ